MTKINQTLFKDFPRILLSLILLLPWISFGQLKVFENGTPFLKTPDGGILSESPTRQIIDLAGVWKYSLNDERWSDVRIPASFDFEGKLTLLRKFSVSDELLTSSAFQLVALGVNYESDFYVNDVFIGRHTGGYTQIELDIPENTLQLGSENTLKVIVANEVSARATLPVRKQVWGWKNYGGILRDIILVATPKLWVDQMIVQQSMSDDLRQGTVNVKAILNSRIFDTTTDSSSTRIRSSQALFSFEIVDRSTGALLGESVPQVVVVPPNRNYEVSGSLIVNAPKLWSVESPELYSIRGKITVMEGKGRRLIDIMSLPLGFRRFEIRKDRFVLNGNPITLNGIVWMEDSRKQGASLSYEQMEKDVALIKVTGANTIRFAFHPPHPHMLDLCSKYGLLALVEAPVWSVPAEILGMSVFAGLAETMVGEMIERDLHQPSVIAWGIGDQFDTSDPRSKAFIDQIAAAMKKLDNRPLYCGSAILNDDLCTEAVEIAAVEIPGGISVQGRLIGSPPEFVKTFKQQLAEWKKNNKEKPVILLGYGRAVVHTNLNGYSDPMSQLAQAKFYELVYQAIRDANIAGSFAFAFSDWRGDRPLLTVQSEDPYIHPVGLMSIAREKRASYETIRLLYLGEKRKALRLGEFRSILPFSHILLGFIIIAITAYLYNYNRRFKETLTRSLIRPYNFYAELRDVHSVSIPQSIFMIVMLSITMGLISSGILYNYRTDKFVDLILTLLIPWDGMKELIIVAAWNPLIGILFFTMLFLVLALILTIAILLLSILVKRRVSLYHAFTVAVWGSLPVIMLSPLGMALFKLLQTTLYVIPSFAIIGLFITWSIIRILKGIAVIFDVNATQAYLGGLIAFIMIAGGFFLYYENSAAMMAQIEFLTNLARNLE